MGKLLIETNIEQVGGVIVESTNGVRNYYIEGPFIQTEQVNRNQRKYIRALMEGEVNNYIENMIKTNRALGELGHPPTPSISHERASHLIESLTPHGNDWMGKARVLTTLPMGKIVKGLIDEDVSFGVSTRGVGALKKVGNITEVHNYKLSTAADVVADPSAPDAWVKGIMEGADWIYDSVNDGWIRQEVVEQAKIVLDKPSRLVSEEMKLKAFEAFITSISGPKP